MLSLWGGNYTILKINRIFVRVKKESIMKKLNLTLLFGLLMLLPLMGQVPYTFKHIGIKEGLSNGFVLDMAIDGKGFVWAATESGLNRLTGDDNTQYKKSNSELVSNELTALYYDKLTDVLWIASQQDGINLFDCRTQQFGRLTTKEGLCTNQIIDLAPAEDGGIWIVHKGGEIQHCDATTHEFVDYTKDNVKGLSGQNFTCMDDGNGHLYIGHTRNGMSILDLKEMTVKNFRYQSDNPQSLPGNYVRSIYKDHLNNIWIGTERGMALFDPLTGSCTDIRHIVGNIHPLAGDNIHCITEMQDHTLWIASDLGGISVLSLHDFPNKHPEETEPVNITHLNSALSSPNIRRLLQDDFGNIWISNYSTGLDFIANYQSRFRILPYYMASEGEKMAKRIYGIATGRDDSLWLGGENELSLCKENRVIKSWNLSSYQKRVMSMLYIIEESRDGMLWLGINDEGVICFNPKTETFKRIDLGVESLDIHAFFEDEEGRMWIGSEAGVYSCHRGDVKKEDEINRKLRSPTVYAIAEDSQGRMWIGSLGGGVQVFEKSGHLVETLTTDNGLCSDNINQIYKDAEGGMWIATYNGLVYVKDTRHPRRWEMYDERQGLDDSHIRAIRQDRSGNIWVSTYTNIAYWNKYRQKFNNYNHYDGVSMGGFVESGAAISKEGTIYFSSPDGVCYFNPAIIVATKQQISPIRLIACEGYIRQQDGGGNRILTLDTDGALRLPHNENSFRISFTVADYSQIGQVEYTYQMKGLDNSWYDTDGENEVTFRNIVPGKYTFRVKARLKNGEWDEKHVLEIPIVIAPPFWLTWYALVVYVILFVVAVWLYVRSYKRKILLRNSLELERQKNLHEQSLNNERLRFYTNITHELRTPLTLIIGPLEDLVNDARLPEAYSLKIKMIHDSALRLLNLINQLLEFRKTETQNRRLTVSRGNLSSLVTEIGLRYKELNRNEKVKIHIDIDQLRQKVWFDADVIQTIVNNLLSNAVKYTQEGEIGLSLHQIEEANNLYIEISVSDTGYGIDEKALPHIFDRYYQAEGKHQASGTGIGLALVKSLVQLHEGTLSVKSKLGEGTTFSFRILSDNPYTDALHKETETAVPENAEVQEEESEETNQRPVLLIVEDNADIREYVSTAFQEHYKIVTACNGKEGFELALQHTPNIIVSDIMMPEMDGIELCRAIKDDMRTSHIPVILLTAKDSLHDKEEGYDSGADSYLTKPFSASLLRSRIHNLLKTRRKLAQKFADAIPQKTDGNIPDDHKEEPAQELNRLDREFLDKLTSLIETNLDMEEMDIAFMTDKMNMSYSTLYRKVKALTNLSVSEFTCKIKIKNSMRLLQSGRYNITEVALMTGFNNLSYFRKCFKKECGMSPSEYVKQNGYLLAAT